MKQIIVDNISTWYYITEDGKCFNSKTNKYLNGQVGANGYLTYYIALPFGAKKRIYAHRTVALAYIPNPQAKPQVNHIDGNKLNNCVDNLEWVTPLENITHSMALELRKAPHVFCFTKEKQLIAEYRNIPEAARAAGVSESMIWQEVNKEKKSLVAGFYWSRNRILEDTIEYKNTGKAKVVNQYDLSGKFITSYPSTGTAARALGLKNPSHIGECCRGKIKSYKGFVWRYAEDIVSPISES